jgi:hypothetical protein
MFVASYEFSFLRKHVCAPTVPSAVIRGSNELEDFGVTDVSKCHILSKCVTSILFLNWHDFGIFCDIVSHCVTV